MWGFFSEEKELNVFFDQEMLLLCWLQEALQCCTTFPLLRANGEKISLKSQNSGFALNFLLSLKDPAVPPRILRLLSVFAEIRADGAAQDRPEGRGFPDPGTDQEGASAPGVPALHLLSLKWSLSSQIGVLSLLQAPH